MVLGTNFGKFCNILRFFCCVFHKIIDSDMIDSIVLHTNKYIERMRAIVAHSRVRNIRETSTSEIMAVLRCLFLIGMRKGQHTNVLELWNSDGTEIEILRACMN